MPIVNGGIDRNAYKVNGENPLLNLNVTSGFGRMAESILYILRNSGSVEKRSYDDSFSDDIDTTQPLHQLKINSVVLLTAIDDGNKTQLTLKLNNEIESQLACDKREDGTPLQVGDEVWFTLILDIF